MTMEVQHAIDVLEEARMKWQSQREIMVKIKAEKKVKELTEYLDISLEVLHHLYRGNPLLDSQKRFVLFLEAQKTKAEKEGETLANLYDKYEDGMNYLI